MASESLVRRPPFARLSEEAKGAWRLDRRPLQSSRFGCTPRIARLPAHDRPVGPQRARCDLHFADAELRSVELRALGADPPRRVSLDETATCGVTETVPTSECRRRHEGTGERNSITCAISWLRVRIQS